MRDLQEFDELARKAEEALDKARDPKALTRLRGEYLGRSGKLTALLKEIKELPEEARRKAGIVGNAAKAKLEQRFEAALSESAARPAEPVDATLPGKKHEVGHYHPVTLVLQELEDIFRGLGFSTMDGPEVEDDWHNFEALNLGPDHPGRDMWDTFYLKGSEGPDGRHRLLPRTHTSPVQIRSMQAQAPPLRVIVPGRVYRNEAEDATHGAIFTNVEGLMVERSLSFADLKGVLSLAFKQLLGEGTKLRFRPSFFPFTEPSAEFDVSSPSVRNGEWLELGGCGMVHPQVLKNAGHNPAQWDGFAFGLGAERIAMLKYGIEDLRQFIKPDLRLLEQF